MLLPHPQGRGGGLLRKRLPPDLGIYGFCIGSRSVLGLRRKMLLEEETTPLTNSKMTRRLSRRLP